MNMIIILDLQRKMGLIDSGASGAVIWATQGNEQVPGAGVSKDPK